MNTTQQTHVIPYLHFELHVQQAMIKAGVWPGQEWFEKEKFRLERDWALGANLKIAIDEWLFRGKAAMVKKNIENDVCPIQYAHKKGWVNYVK
jgi:hypothetical protein